MAAEGRAPLVDFCIRYDPRAQLRNRPNPAHHARGRPRPQLSSFHAPRFVERSAGGRASRHSQPRFHGPEACEGFRRREASPRRDRSRWRLHPNPIDPDTSCRELVVMQVGVACTAGVLVQSTPVTRSPASPACAGPAPGPPHAISREGDHDPLHPRCLPPPDHPVRGWSLSPQTVPSLWIGGAPFRSRRNRAL